jgi:MFS family permease
LGILLVSALRSSRQIVIPLWADHLSISPTATSIIYGLVAAIDMLVFYPAGKAMDQRGRLWVALPSVVLMGASLVLTPLTAGLTSFLIVSMLMGFGNGIGSGLIMTLGADASPRVGRTEFLGIWRLIADMGASGAPVLLSAITALASLAGAVIVTGLLGFVAAGVFWWCLPHTNLARRR